MFPLILHIHLISICCEHGGGKNSCLCTQSWPITDSETSCSPRARENITWQRPCLAKEQNGISSYGRCFLFFICTKIIFKTATRLNLSVIKKCLKLEQGQTKVELHQGMKEEKLYLVPSQ